jgi:ABC-2 type transport system permease protein
MEMSAFNAYFKKEITESLRQYRYLILAAGIIIFAIIDPLMLKLTPMLLKSQVPDGFDITSLIQITQQAAIQNYIKDLFQMSSIFIAFSLCGMLCGEIYSNKFVFPFSKGSSPAQIVLAKFIHYSAVVTIFVFIGFIINYYYSSLLFGSESLSVIDILQSAFLISIYYIFTISLLIFFSSIFKKGIAAGISVLLINYISAVFVKIQSIAKFLPHNIISSASLFNISDAKITIIFTLILSIILLVLTIIRMNKVEVI